MSFPDDDIITAKKMRMADRVASSRENRNACKVLEINPEGKRPPGRRRR
jgi:hypothetical protein